MCGCITAFNMSVLSFHISIKKMHMTLINGTLVNVQTFMYLYYANERISHTTNPKKKLFICDLYRNDAMCISKGTTVKPQYFGTLEFASSTIFLTKQHDTSIRVIPPDSAIYCANTVQMISNLMSLLE